MFSQAAFGHPRHQTKLNCNLFHFDGSHQTLERYFKLLVFFFFGPNFFFFGGFTYQLLTAYHATIMPMPSEPSGLTS